MCVTLRSVVKKSAADSNVMHCNIVKKESSLSGIVGQVKSVDQARLYALNCRQYNTTRICCDAACLRKT